MKKLTIFTKLVLAVLVLVSCENKSLAPEVELSDLDMPEQAYPVQEGEKITLSINGKEVICEQYGEEVIYESDIVLSDEQLNELREANTEVVGFTIRRWPNRTVYYSISSDLPNKNRVYDAMEHWNLQTGIKFVKRTNQSNYVYFRISSGCSSSLGMKGGRQNINLSDRCSTGNTIHEIGHALGMFHEHTRLDRDEFIKVNWNNIKSGKDHNFKRADQRYPGKVKDYTADIDFGSIMMYSSYSFSKNNLPTLVRKNNSTWRSQRKKLSDADIAGALSMYPR